MHCNHSQTKETLLPPDNKHYSQINCLICGKFLAFGKNPKTTERFNKRNKTINKLLTHILNDWQRDFLNSIKDQRTLSLKQESCYQKIVSNFD